MKKIILFRHESWIGAPHLTNLLDEIGINYEFIKVDSGGVIPKDIDYDIAGLVFLGGTMNANSSFKWMNEEINLIKIAYKKGLAVLGHCLGSQLISKALGGNVTTMKNKEIGWYPINFMDNEIAVKWQENIPNETEIMLWHHDEFSIPKGAFPLYTTNNCKNQAFAIDNIVATVAHIELSESMLLDWLDVYGDDINPHGKSIQTINEIKKDLPSKFKKMGLLADTFYLRWLKLVYPKDINSSIYSKISTYLKTGSCMCNKVNFILKHSRNVVNCHCCECRKFHGNYAAFTKTKNKDMHIFGYKHLAWYKKPKAIAKRGFCKTCGSSLFWQKDNSDDICVAVSSLNVPTKLKTTTNIYTDYASDFYEIDKNLDFYPSTMKKDFDK